jgi:hypothetical protein
MELTDFGGPSPSKLIQASSKQVHHSTSESSFKKGIIAFTDLSAIVDKARSFMVLFCIVDKGEVPDIVVA